ncbi:MAG: DNA repair protein RecO [Lachnospiraceae bacterium]|nr:DNA repair protein RecO [Lachnospiraceae bacterium]
MGDVITLTGMILVAAPIKEYDKRIELLTKERGRISAFAQGARKQNSALSACTIPFTFGEFQLYEGRSSYNLQSAVISDYFGEIAQDYDALCYASYFAEVAQYLSRENIEAGNELNLIYITLKAIIAGKVPLKLIKIIYEMRYLALEGEGIELFTCLRCGTEEAYDVYMREGGLICADCASKDKNLINEYPIRLSHDARYTLQYILSSRVEKLYTFTVSDEVLEELQHFMKRYLARYMPHRFKTLDFIV